jgi:hypothetical protein
MIKMGSKHSMRSSKIFIRRSRIRPNTRLEGRLECPRSMPRGAIEVMRQALLRKEEKKMVLTMILIRLMSKLPQKKVKAKKCQGIVKVSKVKALKVSNKARKVRNGMSRALWVLDRMLVRQ